MNLIQIDKEISNDTFMDIVRFNKKIKISNNALNRISKTENLVKKWVKEERVMYGITTGFGSLCTEIISAEDAKQLQTNIVLSHAVSVGDPLEIEYVRAIMLMIILNTCSGYTGVSVKTIKQYELYLNEGITPFVPKLGSVGYLALEAHIGLTIIGKGRVYYNNKLYETKDLLNILELSPIELTYKEGLSLVSGTTSPTGIANVCLYDMKNAMKSADIIGALNLEVNKGTLRAFDDRLMKVRPHYYQGITASNVRNVLESSKYAQANLDYRLQDALSYRCIPQLHGSVKQLIANALDTVTIEMNSCCDNPIIYPIDDDGIAMSGCNPDSSYVGMSMDSACIGIASAAKMSERRNNRLIDSCYSQFPSFLIKKPGLNSGLMIPQYTQAGLLNELQSLCHPSTISNVPTCNNQEDYVAMGYNACAKSIDVVNRFEYILAIELLSIYHSYQFIDNKSNLSSIAKTLINTINPHFDFLDQDTMLHPQIEFLREFLHNGELLNIAKKENIIIE